MRSRGGHRVGNQTFNFTVPSGCIPGEQASLSTAKTLEKGKSQAHGSEKRNWSKESRKPLILQRLAKGHVLNGVWVCVCGRAMAGSCEVLSREILLHVVPRGLEFLFKTSRSSRHQDLGLCKYLFTRNTTSSVSKHYFRAYKTCFFFLVWFSLPHIKNK